MSVAKRTWTTPSGEKKTAWVQRYYDENGKYRQGGTYELKRDAVARDKEIAAELDKGVHRPDRTSITVRAAGALWVKRARGEKLERTTIDRYELFCRVNINPVTVAADVPNGWTGNFGDVKLSQLKTPTCVAFQRELLSRNSRTMACQILAALKAILKEAQVLDLIDYNPAQPIRLKRSTRDQIPIRIGEQIPSKEDIRNILAASTPERFPGKHGGKGTGRGRVASLFQRSRWYPLFSTAAFTGMRASELRGLTWANVDLDRGVIYVHQRADRYGDIGLCKSKSAYRDIQIPDEVVEGLRVWRVICPKSRLGLVFPNSRGNVEYHANTVLYGWYRVQRHLGMVKPQGKAKYAAKYRFHSLRHFYASLMIDEGIEPKRLQALLGHATLSETMDTYGHLFLPGDAVIKRINKAVASVLACPDTIGTALTAQEQAGNAEALPPAS